MTVHLLLIYIVENYFFNNLEATEQVSFLTPERREKVIWTRRESNSGPLAQQAAALLNPLDNSSRASALYFCSSGMVARDMGGTWHCKKNRY